MSRPGHRQPARTHDRWETEHDGGGTGRHGALVVVGAGPTGVEMAGLLADAGDDESAGPIMRLVVEYQPGVSAATVRGYYP